jgi:hypothetical protein
MTTAILPIEPALFKSAGTVFRGKLRANLATIELTADRIVCFEHGRWATMFGAIGALVAMMTRGKRGLEIELSTIAKISRGKLLLNRKLLDIELANGATYRLGLRHYDAFAARLREHLATRVKLVAAGEDVWRVAA